MITISTTTKIILWVIATIAGIVVAVLGSVLAPNILYFLSRRGRPPTQRTTRIWIIFYSCLIIFIVCGAFATFALTPASTSSTIETAGELKVESLPLSIRSYPDTGSNPTVINTDYEGQTPKYLVKMTIPNQGDGLAGMGFYLNDYEDLLSYSYAKVTISFDSKNSSCYFYIQTNLDKTTSVMLTGTGNYFAWNGNKLNFTDVIPINPTKYVFHISLSNFPHTDLSKVKEIGIYVTQDRWRGTREIQVENITFTKQ